MPTTPNREYPYPNGTDAGNVPYAMQQLAEAIDADVQGALELPPYVEFHRSSPQSTVSGADATINLDASPTVVNGTWNLSSGVVTCPADGILALSVKLLFAGGGSPTLYRAIVTLNGTSTWVAVQTADPALSSAISFSEVLRVNAGDTLRVRTHQNSGAPMNVGELSSQPVLALRYLRLL